MNRRSALAALGIALFALSLSARRRSHARQRRAASAQAFAESQEVASCQESIAGRALPVDVNPSWLPTGWAVAPPVFRPAMQQAVIPFVTPADARVHADTVARKVSASGSAVRVPAGVASIGGVDASQDELDECAQSAFIVCEGPIVSLLEMFHDGHSSAAHIVEAYLAGNPMLSRVPLAQLEPLSPAAHRADSAADGGAFTHVVTTAEVTLLVGVHGAYASTAVLTGFPVTIANAAVDGPVTLLSDAIAAIVGATVRVDPVAATTNGTGAEGECGARPFALPGTPAGVLTGQYRVSIADGDRTVVLAVPPDITIARTALDRASSDILASLVGCSGRTGRKAEVPLTRGSLHALPAGAVTLLSAFADRRPPQRELAARVRVLAGQTTPERHTSTSQVTVVYEHPHLRCFFSVQDPDGVVHEPVLTDTPLVMYCPLGADAARPWVMLQEYDSLPPTWESARGDDDELVHNVRFHFTEWDRERTDCAVAELSGLKGVVFTQARDGVCCRSYVIPRGQKILVVRFEAPAAVFEASHPHLQTFLDTLHIDS